MIYNEKHDRYIDNDYVVYRINKEGKLEQCKISYTNGYLQTGSKLNGVVLLHRLIWETFNGEIPENMCIDHINTIRDDNRLENLRVVTRQENMNNPITIEHLRNSKTGEKNPMFGKKPSQKSIDALLKNAETPKSIFGKKFKEHFGFGFSQNEKLYKREWYHYNRYGKCTWE